MPEDVKLISFDDTLYAELATPSLTSLDRQPKKLARTACELLLKKISGESVPAVNYISVELKMRDSTR